MQCTKISYLYNLFQESLYVNMKPFKILVALVLKDLLQINPII